MQHIILYFVITSRNDTKLHKTEDDDFICCVDVYKKNTEEVFFNTYTYNCYRFTRSYDSNQMKLHWCDGLKMSGVATTYNQTASRDLTVLSIPVSFSRFFFLCALSLFFIISFCFFFSIIFVVCIILCVEFNEKSFVWRIRAQCVAFGALLSLMLIVTGFSICSTTTNAQYHSQRMCECVYSCECFERQSMCLRVWIKKTFPITMKCMCILYICDWSWAFLGLISFFTSSFALNFIRSFTLIQSFALSFSLNLEISDQNNAENIFYFRKRFNKTVNEFGAR